MFERFTANARRSVVMAQEEARRLSHNYIGTEHILLGLLRQPGGVAYGVLEGIGISLDGAREEVAAIVAPGKSEPKGHIPFTPRAKKILELSLREALSLRDNYIGTEHILLGLLREGEGVGAQILKAHASLLEIRSAVLDLVPPDDAEDTRPTAAGAALRRMRGLLAGGRETVPAPGTVSTPVPLATASGFTAAAATPAADATLAEAARLAEGALVGSHHLLLAALADPQSAAARVFARLGVDLDRAKEALRTADVTGTSDELPAEAGRRQMSVEVGDEMLTITLTDPVIVAAGHAALRAVNEESAAGERPAPGSASATATVIRGDHRAAASFATVWEAIDASLTSIAGTATGAPAGAPMRGSAAFSPRSARSEPGPTA